MSFWEKRPRNEATWCDIRLEVAAAMASVATEAAWQDAFITCQESRTGGRAARAATAAAVRYPSGGAAFGSGAPPTPKVPAAAVPKLSMAVASGHPPAPREPPAPPQPLEPPQAPEPAELKLVKLEPTGEQRAANEDAAPAMSSPAVASAAAGTTGPGIKEEPSSEAKSPSMPVCLPGTADESGKDGEVDMHGGTLALARCAVDAEDKPDTQALEIRRAEAMATATAPPRFLNGHMLETAFVTWIKQQSEEQQKAIMKSYDSMKLHEEQWVANIGVQEASAPQRRPRQRRVATSLGERLQMATAFGAWRATAGATSRSPLKEARVFLGKGVPFATSRPARDPLAYEAGSLDGCTTMGVLSPCLHIRLRCGGASVARHLPLCRLLAYSPLRCYLQITLWVGACMFPLDRRGRDRDCQDEFRASVRFRCDMVSGARAL